MATMETAQTTNEELIYAGLPQTRTNKSTIAGYPTDNTTSPNDFVAKVQATVGSQKVGPSLTLKVMTGDTINIRVNSWYKLNSVTPSTPQSPLTNIVTNLISGISGSAVVNTHGVTSSQFNTAGSFTPDVTSFLNNQTNNTTGGKPKAFINWIFFDEQFNIVQSASGFEQVGNDTEFKLHVKQPVATKCGFLYVYVSNETPNIPVYFDNLQVSHIRSLLLETNEYYPYGLKMANISYRAASVMVNRYGYNGGNEYEDEGELNYSNTFYRKYDAQIGRFTGVDIRAEEAAFINPYQFGYNNPVMFNDPMGDLSSADWNDLLSRLSIGINNGGFGEYGGSYGGGGGGGGGSSISFFASHEEAFGFAVGWMNDNNAWGSQEGWASSFGNALSQFNGGRITPGMLQGFYTQQWKGTGRENISVNYSSGKREGQGFFVNWAGGNNTDQPTVGSSFLSHEKAMEKFGAGNDISRWGDFLKTTDDIFSTADIGITSKTELIDFAVRDYAGLSKKSFNQLNNYSKSANEVRALGARGAKYLKYSKGIGIVGNVVGVTSAGVQFIENPTAGNATRLAVQGAAIGAAFIPVVGWAVSLGIGAADLIWGDDFYNWIDNR